MQPPSPLAHCYTATQHRGKPSSSIAPANTFIAPDNNPLAYTIIQKPSFLTYSSGPNGHSSTRDCDPPWPNE